MQCMLDYTPGAREPGVTQTGPRPTAAAARTRLDFGDAALLRARVTLLSEQPVRARGHVRRAPSRHMMLHMMWHSRRSREASCDGASVEGFNLETSCALGAARMDAPAAYFFPFFPRF